MFHVLLFSVLVPGIDAKGYSASLYLLNQEYS